MIELLSLFHPVLLSLGFTTSTTSHVDPAIMRSFIGIYAFGVSFELVDLI